MRLAYAGDNVWIGCFLACNERLPDFDLAIHISRPSNVRAGKTCNVVLGQSLDRGLVVSWREGETLDKLSVPVQVVKDYAKQPGKLLIHCTAGVCRSATLAVLAKQARGCDPFTAVADVCRATWTYQEAPLFYHETFREVLGVPFWNTYKEAK